MIDLLVISGPSGVGKGTIIHRLIAEDPTLSLAISATTRPPRTGETDGQHYYFMGNEAFDEAIATHQFLEWAWVHQHRYGTLKSEVERIQHTQRIPLLEIDTEGAMQVKQHHPQATYIFIAPPSLDVLMSRLKGRGTETDEQITHRTQTALIEMDRQKQYDFVVINDIVETAVQSVRHIIRTLSVPHP